MISLKMENYNMILTERLQNLSALSLGKIDKYGYLTGEEILTFNKKQLIEQVYSFSIRRSFWTGKGKTRSS